MIITVEIIEQGKSVNGAWSKKQLLALGIDVNKEFKLKKGWKHKLIGSNVTESNVKLFLSLKDKHIKKKLSPKQLSALIEYKDREKTEFRRKKSIRLMKEQNLHYDCKKCFRGITGNCLGALPDGCEYYFTP